MRYFSSNQKQDPSNLIFFAQNLLRIQEKTVRKLSKDVDQTWHLVVVS